VAIFHLGFKNCVLLIRLLYSLWSNVGVIFKIRLTIIRSIQARSSKSNLFQCDFVHHKFHINCTDNKAACVLRSDSLYVLLKQIVFRNEIFHLQFQSSLYNVLKLCVTLQRNTDTLTLYRVIQKRPSSWAELNKHWCF
jgi:hypothetical protein